METNPSSIEDNEVYVAGVKWIYLEEALGCSRMVTSKPFMGVVKFYNQEKDEYEYRMGQTRGREGHAAEQFIAKNGIDYPDGDKLFLY